MRKLLRDLEKQSKAHIEEVNSIHDQYRHYVHKTRELEEKCKTYKKDAEIATESERSHRKELKKIKLQNESLIKRLTNAKHQNANETAFSRGQESQESSLNNQMGGEHFSNKVDSKMATAKNSRKSK